MIRLHMTVEGQTEQAFVSQLLVEHLARFGVFLGKPRLTGASARRGERIPAGGMFKFAPVLGDMKRWLVEDQSPDARFTMMVDLYDLPNDCPGHANAMRLADPYDRVESLEKSLAEEMGDTRFIPYFQLHEFEALVLSRPDQFGDHFDKSDKATTQLLGVCRQFRSPEHINQGRETHPKARILDAFPDYHANVDGPLLAQNIGLQAMREACLHFAQWLERLEQLDMGES